jgi:hypothetical protein
MPLQRYRYVAYLTNYDDPDGEPVAVDVEVRHGDLLRAELEAGAQNLPVDPRKAPQQTTALWVWASLVRTRVVDVDYRTFRDGNDTRPPVLVSIEQKRDPVTGEPDTPEVPPTSPGSDSPSPSLPGSADSTAGSTPTPTND